MSTTAPPPAPPLAPASLAPLSGPRPGRVRVAVRWPTLTRAQWGILGTLIAFAFAPFVITAVEAARHHRDFVGAFGMFPWDTLQYLSFVSDAHGGLIRNLFGLTGQPVYVDPVWSPTGIVQGLTGAGPALVMAFWTLVSSLIMFAGALHLVARHIPADRPWRHNIALVMCLFGGVTMLLFLPEGASVSWIAGFSIDLVPAQSLWGYPATAIAVGLMPFVVTGMEAIVAGTATRRTAGRTIALCGLVGWLHPWQAGALLLIWLGLLAWHARDRMAGTVRGAESAGSGNAASRPRVRVAAAVIVALAAGPGYYACLSHIDYSWAQFDLTDARRFWISWPFVEYGLLPLALVALAGARAVRGDRRARGLVLWPLMTLVLLALRPPELYHSLGGVALPLGVLVVRAWPDAPGRRLRRVAISGYLALALAGITVLTVQLIEYMQTPSVTAYTELRPSDVRAVEIAARVDQGRPILTTFQLGSAVPMLVDAPTWVGNQFWTPNGPERGSEAGVLLAGGDAPAQARRFVASTGAVALVQPCGLSGRLEPELGPAGFRERVVGCAHVYWRPRGARTG